MSWLLCRTCALQTHAPKTAQTLEADFQCCLHHFDELKPQGYPGSMFRLLRRKIGMPCAIVALCTLCLLLFSIESIHVYTIYLPCAFLGLCWLSCSQTSGTVPADLAQSTARSLASDLLEGLSAQQRSCYSEPSGPIFLLQRKRLTCSTFTMSSPTARRWRFHLDNPWYSRHNIQNIFKLQTISIIQLFHGSGACRIDTLHISTLFITLSDVWVVPGRCRGCCSKILSHFGRMATCIATVCSSDSSDKNTGGPIGDPKL